MLYYFRYGSEEVCYEKQTIGQKITDRANSPNTVFLMLGIGTLRMSLCEALGLYAGECFTTIVFDA